MAARCFAWSFVISLVNPRSLWTEDHLPLRFHFKIANWNPHAGTIDGGHWGQTERSSGHGRSGLQGTSQKHLSQSLDVFDLTMVIGLWYDWDDESCEFSGCGRNSQSGGECQQHENGLPARHQVLLMMLWPMDVNDRKSYHMLPAWAYFCTPRRSESRHATIPRSCARLGCWGGTWTKPCRLSTLPLRWTELWCAHAWEEPGCAHDAHVMRIRKVQDKSFWHCRDMG